MARRVAPAHVRGLPGTDEVARTHLAIPISSSMTREQVDEVVGAMRHARLG